MSDPQVKSPDLVRVDNVEKIFHRGAEEIHVLSKLSLLVPAGEKHMAVNTGTEPLVLLCFFPVPDVSAGTTEFASF